MCENYEQSLLTNKISNISKVIQNYVYSNYECIKKNNQTILINKKFIDNIRFWKNIYSNWEIEKFNIFDEYLNN